MSFFSSCMYFYLTFVNEILCALSHLSAHGPLTVSMLQVLMLVVLPLVSRSLVLLGVLSAF